MVKGLASKNSIIVQNANLECIFGFLEFCNAGTKIYNEHSIFLILKSNENITCALYRTI